LFIESVKQLQHSGAKKQFATINEGSLQSNWVGLLDNPTMTQLAISNQAGEVNQQPVILKHVTTKKTLKEIIRNINKQVLETKYTLNLGQLL
jgi:phosphoribosylpyrophosphate synthetase